MQGRDPLFDNIPGCGVDPRNLAQRVMAVCDVKLLLCVLFCTVAVGLCDIGIEPSPMVAAVLARCFLSAM